MAGGFLHKIFGSTGPVPAEVRDALRELERLAGERPELAGPIDFLGAVLPNLYQDSLRDCPPAPTPAHAAAKLSAGIPLLRGENLDLDVKEFRRRWLDVCEAAQGRHGGETAAPLAEALRRERLDALELMQETLAGRPESIYAKAEWLDLDAGLLATVLRLTLFPVLVQANAALAPLRDGILWHRGHCPTCGSWPLLGEFRGLEQNRFLRCGLCAAQWDFPRLLCPFCGNSDHNRLGYLHAEGEEAKYRVSTCDECRGYVKMLSTLTALTPPQLLVAEVATMHLDLVAAEHNYLAQP
jgi:FdhE protein